MLNASVILCCGTITSPPKVRQVVGIPCQFFIEPRRFPGMTKMPLLPIRKLQEVSSIRQLVDVLWLLEASGKLFRWLFGENMFAGMSSQILGKKFGI